MGRAWKALSDEEKQQWEAESQKDQERYRAECAEAGVQPKLFPHIAGQVRTAQADLKKRQRLLPSEWSRKAGAGGKCALERLAVEVIGATRPARTGQPSVRPDRLVDNEGGAGLVDPKMMISMGAMRPSPNNRPTGAVVAPSPSLEWRRGGAFALARPTAQGGGRPRAAQIERPSERTIARAVGKKWNAATRSFVSETAENGRTGAAVAVEGVDVD